MKLETPYKVICPRCKKIMLKETDDNKLKCSSCEVTLLFLKPENHRYEEKK